MTARQKLLRWVLPPLVTILLLGAAIYILQQAHLFDQIDLSHPRWGWLAVLVGLQVISLGLFGFAESRYVLHLGVTLTFEEWYGVNAISALLNLIFPLGGGAVFRASYYELQHGLHPPRFLAVIAASTLITTLVSGASGLIVLGVLLAMGLGEAISWIAPAIFIVLTLVPLVLLIVPAEHLDRHATSRIARLARQALDGWAEIRTNPSLIAQQAGLVVITVGVQGLCMVVGVLGLGLDAPALPLFFVGIALSAWRVVPVLSVDANEVVSGLISPLVGVSPSVGLLGAVATRLASWVVIFTLGPLFAYLLSRRVGKSPRELLAALQADARLTD